MNIFNVNTDQQAVDLLPPDKRDTQPLSIVRALLKPLQYCRDLVFDSYKTGATAPVWVAGTYHQFDQVQYQKGVWQALVTTTAAPSTPDWMLIQPNFIGIDERAQYNGTKLLFEWALNRWFKTMFRQPTTFNAAPDYYLPKSDIFLTTNTLLINVFRVGLLEDESSSVGLLDSSEYVYDNFAFTNTTSLSINVPVAVWTALSTVSADRDNIIRNFADKYVTAGIIYDIITY